MPPRRFGALAPIIPLALLVLSACTPSRSDPIDGLVEAATEGLMEIEDPDRARGGVGDLFHREGCPLWGRALPVGTRSALGFGDQFVVCAIGSDEAMPTSGLLLMAELVTESRGSSIEAFWREIESGSELRPSTTTELQGGGLVTSRCWPGQRGEVESCAADFRHDELRVILVDMDSDEGELSSQLARQLPSILEELAQLEQ